MRVNRDITWTHGRTIDYPTPHVPQTEGSQIGDRRLSTSCGVVEWPDHHCGDDLVWPVAMSSVGCRPSQSVQREKRTSQERFDLVSPNFTLTPTPAYSSIAPEMTSLASYSRKLLRKKTFENAFPTTWRRFVLMKSLTQDHEMLQLYREQYGSQMLWLRCR